LSTDRIARVVGLSSSVLFDKANPRSPINRRISIIVMTHEAEEEAIKTEVPLSAAPPAATAAAAALPETAARSP
jgi:chemotaxis protein MotB